MCLWRFPLLQDRRKMPVLIFFFILSPQQPQSPLVLIRKVHIPFRQSGVQVRRCRRWSLFVFRREFGQQEGDEGAVLA